MRTSGVLDALDAALTQLVEADPVELSDLALVRRLTAMQTRLCRLQALLSRDVAAVHARGAAVADGFASSQALLRCRLRLDKHAATRQVRVGARLAELPDTAAAFAAGEISLSHVAALCQAVRDLGAEVMAGGAEKLLLDEARSGSPAAVYRLARLIRERVDPDTEEDRQARQHRERWLSADRTFQGAVSVQGVLDPVTGQLLLTALDAFTPARSVDDERMPGQRRVDALADICRAALGSADVPSTGEHRPHMTVTVPLDTLQGAAGHDAALFGPAGEPVCAETARRMACDAGVIPAVLGSNGEPLDIGRLTRTIPTGIRRALILRDRGCRFPGCDQPPHRTDGHHLAHWSRGGPTNLTNLILVCAFHHWLVHEGHWSIHYDPDTNILTAYRPGGTPYDLISRPRGPSP
jgi:hypothetical protein